jgi:hypothetical protein
VESLSSSAVSISESLIGRSAPVAARPFRAPFAFALSRDVVCVSSTKLFHVEHSTQRPIHLGEI